MKGGLNNRALMQINFRIKHFLNVFRHPLLGASPWALLRMMVRLRTFFTWAFTFKWLFVFLMSLLNAPLIIADKIITVLRNPRKVKSPVFIIGHPRSGTTYLHNLMMKDPQFSTPQLYEVLFPNYPNTFGAVLKRIIHPLIPGKRPQDNVAIDMDSPQEEEFGMAGRSGFSFFNGFYFPRKFKENLDQNVLFKTVQHKKRWQKAFIQYIRKIKTKKGNTIVLKSPANMGRIAAILEIFPDAKFIHIHRHPEDTFRSSLHLFEEVLPQTSFQTIGAKEMLENAFYMYEKLFDKFFMDQKKVPQEQWAEVAFEDLRNNPAKTMQNIYRSVRLVPSSELQNEWKKLETKNAVYQMNKHLPLPSEVKKRLQKAGQKVYLNYNYS